MIKTAKEFAKITPREIESKVIELARQGDSPEKIGLILRDQHGIPKVKMFGKKICQILKENKIDANPEYKNINKKIENLRIHAQKHKHDYIVKRRIAEYSSRLKKLEK